MQVRMNKKNITFTDVMNESQLDHIRFPAKEAGVKIETKDFGTKYIVSGTPEQMNEFVKLYNQSIGSC